MDQYFICYGRAGTANSRSVLSTLITGHYRLLCRELQRVCQKFINREPVVPTLSADAGAREKEHNLRW